ncbi:chemotaxis protein CheW [Motilimonas sp. 1_MG-2023]|uniref:chemotaxis protein CheW n=1 Tax=Motilimonas sp. 1_MG-2023 TaxID=3062672 RepID=UPI0026E1DF1A|nr:chemotaxis protein CheW [Motilimonas sp. 1_MG-2023]MDO6526845.1 chemotaxis protein CheW [Motilimonas sp. 1_MG-2023]
MAELITGYGIEHEEFHQQYIETVTQYLTFSVANETLAVNILAVNEIIEVSEITFIPRMPEFIRGVINLRGAAVPVVDFSLKTAKGVMSKLSDKSCIVLVDVNPPSGGNQAIGLLVDAVKEIVEFDHNSIQSAPQVGDSNNADYIQAMGKLNEVFVIILEVDNILSSGQIKSLMEIN